MKSTRKFKSTKDHYYKIIPLALILLIVPCIVYLKIITITGAAVLVAPVGDTSYDFFSYYKVIWLIVFTLLSCALCIIYLKTKKMKFNLPIIFIPLFVYYLFVILSTAFSEYHDIVYFGFTDRLEGFIVITCYMLICLMAANFITYEKDIKILFGAIVTCGFIVGILGITQFWGIDFFQSGFGKSLITPIENHNLLDTLSFKFPKQYIYSTLYNPNYVGSFCAMLFPIGIALSIFSKKVPHKIISCIFSCVVFINLIGCLSTTGYNASAISIILLIVVLNKNFFKAWRTMLILLFSFSVLLFWMNSLSSGSISPSLYKLQTANAQLLQVQPSQEQVLEVKTQVAKTPAQVTQPQPLKSQTLLLQTSQSIPKPIEIETSSPEVNSTPSVGPKKITDFNIDKNTFKIYMDNYTANILFDFNTSSCSFNDASGKDLNYKKDPSDSNIITFDDPNYSSLTVKFNGNYLNISASNVSFNVYISQEEKIFKFVDHRGNPTNIASPESIGFEGREKWGSSRGYIWSRSLPLLKDTLFIGYGPDTFELYFPQNEFNSKLKYFDSPYILVNKPHSMYLQMALNTGVPSLVAFIVFVLFYLVTSIKLYFKPKDINTYYVAGVSCLTAVVGFLVASIANDSVICVSPVFWILLGIGIACNRLYSKSFSSTTPQKTQAFTSKNKVK